MTKNIRTLTAAFALALSTLVGSTAFAAPVEHDALELSSSADSSADSSVDGGVESDGDRFDATVTLEGVVNINTATAEQLELLPGIGPAIAKKIVDYRKEHPFKQRNNIMRIKGIGQKTFAKLKDFLVVEGETTLRVAG